VPAALLLVLSIAQAASGAIITFTTPTGATAGGLPVDANATFTLSNNQIIITLDNLLANPKGVSQDLSGLAFTVSTGQTAGSIIADSAIPRTVSGDGSFTDGAAVSAGWDLSSAGGQIVLDALGSGVGPAHTIIGPPGGSAYSSANSSIAGNGPHNPFLDQSVVWTLNVPGVTGSSTITSVTFSFGTTSGSDVVAPPGMNPAPEPVTMGILLAGGLLGLTRRRRLGK
jgi:hypothetical protein